MAIWPVSRAGNFRRNMGRTKKSNELDRAGLGVAIKLLKPAGTNNSRLCTGLSACQFEKKCEHYDKFLFN